MAKNKSVDGDNDVVCEMAPGLFCLLRESADGRLRMTNEHSGLIVALEAGHKSKGVRPMIRVFILHSIP